MHVSAAEERKKEMAYKMDVRACDVSDARYNTDDAFDYECTHDYNRIHISFICNGYKYYTLQDAQRQRKSIKDTIYILCNNEISALR